MAQVQGLFGDWGREPKWLVECEIEVLYQILAWGVLKKMKNNPHGIKPAKVQKAGLHTFALFVKSCQAWAVHVARHCFAVAVGLPATLAAIQSTLFIPCCHGNTFYVQLVKYFYFTFIANTIACSYSTPTNYSLQLQLLYIIYARGHTRFCAYNVPARIIYYIGIPKHIFLSYYRYILHFMYFSIFARYV